jgi:MFS family permease
MYVDRKSPAPRQRWLNRTVIGAGLTSAFGDFAYETTNVILPGFLSVLGLPPAWLGAIEGIADATASFTKLASGYIAARLGMRKVLVVFGYALTPAGQALIALALGWPLIAAGRVLSWFGKGIRGPLRDAIVAESIAPQARGRAFGFHRAMDTLGAVVGPLLGIGLLSWVQQYAWNDAAAAFRVVFWCTLVPGVLSVLSFSLLVRDQGGRPQPELRFWSTLSTLPSRFRRYLLAVGVFGIGDFSHSLLILAATQLLAPELGVVRATQAAGILYVVRNVVQTFASYPIGAAADRIGHMRVLSLGYLLGAATSLIVALVFATGASGYWTLTVLFVIAGLYTAVQEALEPSLTADLVRGEHRGVAYGALGAVNGFGKLVSSVVVGAVWTVVSPAVAFAAAGAVMGAGTVMLLRIGREPQVLLP